MEPNSDKTKPWWIYKHIGDRTVFYSGHDTNEEANALRDKVAAELAKDHGNQITLTVASGDESLLK